MTEYVIVSPADVISLLTQEYRKKKNLFDSAVELYEVLANANYMVVRYGKGQGSTCKGKEKTKTGKAGEESSTLSGG